MAQRDYEDQPEAPDLGASVQLENDQMLAGPPGDQDALDAGYVPPDRPYVLDDDDMTHRGMREGDTIDQRLHRERPEDARDADPDRAGRIVLAGGGAALETPDSVDGVDVGISGGAASAEEAAVHVVPDTGSPVEVEPSLADDPALADPELEAALADDDAADAATDAAVRDIEDDGEFVVPGRAPDAARLDADRRSAGVAAPASGRRDVGPDSGL
jgi:hypothetical protein